MCYVVYFQTGISLTVQAATMYFLFILFFLNMSTEPSETVIYRLSHKTDLSAQEPDTIGYIWLQS